MRLSRSLRLCMAHDFPSFSADPWEKENFYFPEVLLLAFQHSIQNQNITQFLSQSAEYRVGFTERSHTRLPWWRISYELLS